MGREKGRFSYFMAGTMIGILLGIAMGAVLYRYRTVAQKIYNKIEEAWPQKSESARSVKTHQVIEDFKQPIVAEDGKSFGREKQLTFELFRNGIFIIDGKSGLVWQKSDYYGDVALIRSSRPLPKTYKISVTVGGIDYSLDRISGLSSDPQYPEGPLNENGAYFIAIADQLPSDPHTNIWWHQHRKVVIDVDNNTWGHGMPNPIFMVYFNPGNNLRSWDPEKKEWTSDWKSSIHYEPNAWYRIELEKTSKQFKFSILDEQGKLLQSAQAPLSDIWNEDAFHKDYFVIGDPHENYYQGSMKIKSIEISVEER